MDGNEEAILENSEMSLGFSAADGGTLFEWDCRRRPFNLVNTLTRREEVYHDLLREGRVRRQCERQYEYSHRALLNSPGLAIGTGTKARCSVPLDAS